MIARGESYVSDLQRCHGHESDRWKCLVDENVLGSESLIPLRTRPRLRWITKLWEWRRTWAWRRGSRSWRSFIWARRGWRVPTAMNEEASRDSRRRWHRCSPSSIRRIIIMVRWGIHLKAQDQAMTSLCPAILQLEEHPSGSESRKGRGEAAPLCPPLHWLKGIRQIRRQQHG